jgi:hypothetical protein
MMPELPEPDEPANPGLRCRPDFDLHELRVGCRLRFATRRRLRLQPPSVWQVTGIMNRFRWRTDPGAAAEDWHGRVELTDPATGRKTLKQISHVVRDGAWQLIITIGTALMCWIKVCTMGWA